LANWAGNRPRKSKQGRPRLECATGPSLARIPSFGPRDSRLVVMTGAKSRSTATPHRDGGADARGHGKDGRSSRGGGYGDTPPGRGSGRSQLGGWDSTRCSTKGSSRNHHLGGSHRPRPNSHPSTQTHQPPPTTLPSSRNVSSWNSLLRTCPAGDR